MSYNIYKTESHEFCMPIKTLQERNRFLDFARHLMVEYIAFLDEKEKRSANYRTHSAQDVRDAYGELWGNVRSWEDTLDCLRRFLTNTWDCPFRLETFKGGDSIWFEFDFDSGSNWYGDDELVFIKAFAPFAKEGAFIGFEGEDNCLWSYVYDGQGDFQECEPSVDWRAGYKKPQPQPVEEAPERLFYLAVLSARDEGPIEMLEIAARSEEEAMAKAREHLLGENFITQWAGTKEEAETWMDEEEFEVSDGLVKVQ